MHAGESATSPPWVGIHDSIERELAIAMAHSFDKGPKPDGRQLDQYLHDAVLRFEAQA